MKYFSYLFHGVLGLCLLFISGVALVSNTHNLRIELLPWQREALTYSLLAIGLASLITMLLAWRGILRPLFMVWSLVVALMLVRTYWFSPYSFTPNTYDYVYGILFCLGALMAAAGGWIQFRCARARR